MMNKTQLASELVKITKSLYSGLENTDLSKFEQIQGEFDNLIIDLEDLQTDVFDNKIYDKKELEKLRDLVGYLKYIEQYSKKCGFMAHALIDEMVRKG